MELPRGQFRAVLRNIKLDTLLHDLSGDRFTGYCKIVHEQRVMVIVLQEGRIILAENQGISGDEALEGVFFSQDLIVDAELKELNVFQLKLAVEFNPEKRVNEYHPRDLHLMSPAPQEVFMKMDPPSDTIPQKTPVIFEPLEGSSVLFETRPNLKKAQLMDIPDFSDRWRVMGVTRSENPSV